MSKPATASRPADDHDSDAAIGAMLASHPGLLDVARSECDAAIARCHALNQAPRGWIMWQVERTRDRIREQSRRAGGDKAAVDVASFREYRDGAKVFDALAVRWQRATERDAVRAISRELEQEMADDAHRLVIANWPRPEPPIAFDARAFVDGLLARGIFVMVDGEGAISVMPTNKLTKEDRAAIHANRAAVAAAASGLVETF
jgi:hypothetical protein